MVRDAAWSGATRAFADAAVLLAARGYETCFVVPSGSEAERCLAAAGHDVIGVRGGGGWLRAGWRLRGVVASRLSEVLFVHDDREHLGRRGRAPGRARGRGATHAIRRTADAGPRWPHGDAPAATGFVFAHADDARGVAPPRGALAAHVAPPGVAIATPRPPAAVGAIGGAVAQRLVVIVGADRRREALVALRALSLLSPRLPALRATVLWPAADIDAVRLEAAALGVADRIAWRATGAPRADVLAEADLAWVIAASDDAVFAMFDALVHGVPVLAERSPVTGRVIDDGVTGWLRHRADETEWASVVAAALAHPERMDHMRGEARRAAARWPFDAGADGWVQVTEAARDRSRWTP